MQFYETWVQEHTGFGWRVCESQFNSSTRQLVDSGEEHDLLESMIDQVKPKPRYGEEFEGLHYLLASSFRYPPLRHGSRFGRYHEPSLWYGSETVTCALAEIAYYRFVFFSAQKHPITTVSTTHTAYRTRLSSKRYCDLTSPPMVTYLKSNNIAVSSKSDYADSQHVGTLLRHNNIDLFRYPSARDPGHGANFGAFSPQAFAKKSPERKMQSWHCVTSSKHVEFSRHDIFVRGSVDGVRFKRTDFEVNGTLPWPAS